MKNYVITFPGQGSQSFGMMAKFEPFDCIKATFEEASDVIGDDLWAMLTSETDNINQTIGSLRIDIFVHDIDKKKVYLLEIKAVKNIGEIEVCQVNRYSDMLLKNYGTIVDEGYIINFTQPTAKAIPEDIMIQKVI